MDDLDPRVLSVDDAELAHLKKYTSPTCGACHRGSQPKKKLRKCDQCSISMHVECLPNPLDTYIRKVPVDKQPPSQISTDGIVKEEPESVMKVFMCPVCQDSPPDCGVCSAGFDVVESVSAGEHIFRCSECLYSTHISCLLEEGKQLQKDLADMERRRVVPVTADTDYLDLDVFKQPLNSFPACFYCRMFGQAVPERILGHRRVPKTNEHEFYIKFKDISHWWNRWVPHFWINHSSPNILRNYRKKYMLLEEHVEDSEMHEIMIEDEMFLEAYRIPESVISHEKVELDDEIWHRVLVKWTDIPHDGCTWELVPDSSPHMHQLKPLIERHESFTDLSSKENRLRRYEKAKVNIHAKNVLRQVNNRHQFKELLSQPQHFKNVELHQHQLEGLNWMLYQWYLGVSAILADDMGLGKTIQAIAVLKQIMHEKEYFPHLIVVPNSTLMNWKSEFAIWAPEMKVVVYHGNQAARNVIKQNELFADNKNRKYLKCHVVLTTNEIAFRDIDVFQNIEFETLIVDEGHRLKDRNSKTFNALLKIRKWWKLLLTGTPMQNNTIECINLLHFLDPVKFADLQDLEEKYETVHKDNVADLHKMLQGHILRRTKGEIVELKIPPKIEVIIPIHMSRLQRDLYKRILAKNFDFLKESSRVTSKFARRTGLNNVLMELMKLLNHPYLVQGGAPAFEENASEQSRHRAMVECCAKLVIVHHMLKRLKANGHRVLLFSTMTRVLDILQDYIEAEGYGYCRLDGDMTQLEKQRAIEAFNAPNSDRFIFLISTRAGGLGLNLTSADTVIIYNSDYNPHNDLQALARAHRIGQTKKVVVYRLVTQNSVEEKIIQKARHKLALDHLVIEKMGEVLQAEDIETFLQYGAKKLFEEMDDEEDGKREITMESNRTTDELISNWMDVELHGVEEETPSPEKNIFGYVRVWKNDTKEEPEEEEQQNPASDFWDKLLEGHVPEKDEVVDQSAVLGRVEGRSGRLLSRENMAKMAEFLQDSDEDENSDAYEPGAAEDESSSDDEEMLVEPMRYDEMMATQPDHVSNVTMSQLPHLAATMNQYAQYQGDGTQPMGGLPSMELILNGATPLHQQLPAFVPLSDPAHGGGMTQQAMLGDNMSAQAAAQHPLPMPPVTQVSSATTAKTGSKKQSNDNDEYRENTSKTTSRVKGESLDQRKERLYEAARELIDVEPSLADKFNLVPNPSKTELTVLATMITHTQQYLKDRRERTVAYLQRIREFAEKYPKESEKLPMGHTMTDEQMKHGHKLMDLIIATYTQANAPSTSESLQTQAQAAQGVHANAYRSLARMFVTELERFCVDYPSYKDMVQIPLQPTMDDYSRGLSFMETIRKTFPLDPIKSEAAAPLNERLTNPVMTATSPTAALIRHATSNPVLEENTMEKTRLRVKHLLETFVTQYPEFNGDITLSERPTMEELERLERLIGKLNFKLKATTTTTSSIKHTNFPPMLENVRSMCEFCSNQGHVWFQCPLVNRANAETFFNILMANRERMDPHVLSDNYHMITCINEELWEMYWRLDQRVRAAAAKQK